MEEKLQAQVIGQTNSSIIRRELDQEWARYVFEDTEPKRVRPLILESWHRCRDFYNIDPGRKRSPVMLSQEGLLTSREQNEILHVARPFFDELTNVLKDTGYVIGFSDADGWMLELDGDRRVLTALKELADYPGTNCKEEFVGTSAVGVALAEKRPVQIFTSEHYVEAWHPLTGYATPILDPFSHEPRAVIAVTGFTEVMHPHMLLVVYMAAHAMEEKFRQMQILKDQQIVNDYWRLAAGRLSDGLLCIDQHGRIVQINPAARQVLRLSEASDTLDACPDLKQALLSMLHHQPPLAECEEHKIYCPQTDKYLNTATFPTIYEGRVIGATVLIPIHGAQSKGPACGYSEETLARRGGLKQARARYTFDHILGEGAEIQLALRLAKLAATNTLSVLLIGESGTGKEMFAQAIHNASPRAHMPFIVVNCGAIPDELIEAELFGYEAGAFTGARYRGNAGKFERADGGTIFLDEVSELSPNAQVTLLRVLQEMEIVRLGSSLPTAIDVRVIAASNRDLREETEAGRFRRDLYYRLNVLPIELPPLRRRREDIPLLANAILDAVIRQLKQHRLTLSPEAMEVLLAYNWPGNVREFQNVLQRAAVLTQGLVIGLEDLPAELTTARTGKRIGECQAGKAVAPAIEERELFLKVLKQCLGNVSEASRQLGLSRKTLYRKMEKYAI